MLRYMVAIKIKKKKCPGFKREYVIGNKISTRYLHVSLFQWKLKNGEKNGKSMDDLLGKQGVSFLRTMFAVWV